MTHAELTSRLGIQHPVIQGPFGGGFSTPLLAATVTNRGGLGSYGAHRLSPDDILRVAGEIRALTTGPFALNLWVSGEDPGGLDVTPEEFERVALLFAPYFRELGLDPPVRPERREIGLRFDEQIGAVLEARPAVLSFVFGIPSQAVLAECRTRGIVTSGSATSVAEARALDEAGVDVIVATGSEAGGHRPSFLAHAEDSLMGTFALVPLVADRVRAPVVAAGGIVDARGVRAAHALGACGVQIGTAFLACEESGASPEHRDLLFGERAYRTVLTRSFSGRLARGIANRWTDEMTTRTHDIAPYPLQGWFTAQLRRAANTAAGVARTELVSLWCGQAAPNLRHRTANALIDSLVTSID